MFCGMWVLYIIPFYHNDVQRSQSSHALPRIHFLPSQRHAETAPALTACMPLLNEFTIMGM